MVLKIGKFSLILLMTLLLSIHVVRSFMLTQPLPVGIKTLRGESQEFYFQIQNIGSDDELTCSYSVTGVDPIVVTLDKEKITVDSNEVKNIYGTVSVPDDAEIKIYQGQLTAKCSPSGGVEGTGSAVQSSMTVRFTVNVLETKPEGPTPYIPREIPATYNLTMIILIIIIIILVIGGYYWSERKKK